MRSSQWYNINFVFIVDSAHVCRDLKRHMNIHFLPVSEFNADNTIHPLAREGKHEGASLHPHQRPRR